MSFGFPLAYERLALNDVTFTVFFQATYTYVREKGGRGTKFLFPQVYKINQIIWSLFSKTSDPKEEGEEQVHFKDLFTTCSRSKISYWYLNLNPGAIVVLFRASGWLSSLDGGEQIVLGTGVCSIVVFGVSAGE